VGFWGYVVWLLADGEILRSCHFDAAGVRDNQTDLDSGTGRSGERSRPATCPRIMKLRAGLGSVKSFV